jgi:hypothetical protein
MGFLIILKFPFDTIIGISYTIGVQLLPVQINKRCLHMETKRIDIRIPKTLLKDIEKYQTEQKITSRTAALLELVRVGLNKNKKEGK